jgi:hypothetical protein
MCALHIHVVLTSEVHYYSWSYFVGQQKSMDIRLFVHIGLFRPNKK